MRFLSILLVLAHTSVSFAAVKAQFLQGLDTEPNPNQIYRTMMNKGFLRIAANNQMEIYRKNQDGSLTPSKEDDSLNDYSDSLVLVRKSADYQSGPSEYLAIVLKTDPSSSSIQLTPKIFNSKNRSLKDSSPDSEGSNSHAIKVDPVQFDADGFLSQAKIAFDEIQKRFQSENLLGANHRASSPSAGGERGDFNPDQRDFCIDVLYASAMIVMILVILYTSFNSSKQAIIAATVIGTLVESFIYVNACK